MHKIDQNNPQLWMNIIRIISAIFLLLIGYIIGHYIIGGQAWINPISYGIGQLNNYNNDNISCTCYSSFGKAPITFTKEGVEQRGQFDFGNKINLSSQNLMVNPHTNVQ